MYPHTDCFISYSDDFIVKQEKLSDSDSEMPKPYPLESSSPLFLSPKKPRAESFACETIQKLVSTDFLAKQSKRKPFTIIRDAKRYEDDPIKVKLEPEKKLMNNDRKEVRKRRTKKQDNTSGITVKEEAGIEVKLEEGSSRKVKSEETEKSQKKMVQMIRNRISAQSSRDRRKAQMQALEDGKDVLSQENQRLWSEKTSLMKEVQKLEQSNNKLMAEKQRLLKKKKKKNEKLECMGCLKNSQEAVFSMTNFDDLWKNVGQEDFLGLSMEQRELGFSIGISMGMAMIESLKGDGKVKSVSHGSRKTEACTAFEEEEGDFEEEDFFFGRKFSRSTLASPNLSSLTQGSFISEDLELHKPALTSFWDSEKMNEGKLLEKGEKKFSIDFQKKVMMENVMDGGALKQRMSPLAVGKGGCVRLLNSQEGF